MAELATKISSSVAELEELLAAKKMAAPSFDVDSPVALPPDMSDLQDAVLDATAELHDMLLEPMSLVFKFSAVGLFLELDEPLHLVS